MITWLCYKNANIFMDSFSCEQFPFSCGLVLCALQCLVSMVWAMQEYRHRLSATRNIGIGPKQALCFKQWAMCIVSAHLVSVTAYTTGWALLWIMYLLSLVCRGAWSFFFNDFVSVSLLFRSKLWPWFSASSTQANLNTLPLQCLQCSLLLTLILYFLVNAKKRTLGRTNVVVPFIRCPDHAKIIKVVHLCKLLLNLNSNNLTTLRIYGVF